jgi:hypothetical protein
MLNIPTILLLCFGATLSSAKSSLRGLQGLACSINFDCPQPPCSSSPCPTNYCDNGFCAISLPDDPDRNDNNIGYTNNIVTLPLVPCDYKTDCAPVNCFIPPCDENKCIDGFCTLVTTEDRNDLPNNNVNNETLSNGGEPCGSATCDLNQVCCNESCGICTEVGGVCTAQYCDGYVGSDINGTVDEDEGQDEEDDGDANGDQPDGSWISVTRGACNCQGLCSVCQETIFGVCLTLYCFP